MSPMILGQLILWAQYQVVIETHLKITLKINDSLHKEKTSQLTINLPTNGK